MNQIEFTKKDKDILLKVSLFEDLYEIKKMIQSAVQRNQ